MMITMLFKKRMSLPIVPKHWMIRHREAQFHCIRWLNLEIDWFTRMPKEAD